MNNSFKRVLKLGLTSIFLILSLTSCSNVINELAHKSPDNHKNITGSNNFDSLVKSLVDESSARLKRNIAVDDVVLVSDFVNLDRLKNRSKLGFLLSDHLKDALLNHDIIVRQVELGRDFQYGKHGFNLLTRNQRDINKKSVDAPYAFVGTYTITTKNLIVFVKLIDIKTGNILSSSRARTSIDEEILELEGLTDRKMFIRQPMVL